MRNPREHRVGQRETSVCGLRGRSGREVSLGGLCVGPCERSLSGLCGKSLCWVSVQETVGPHEVPVGGLCVILLAYWCGDHGRRCMKAPCSLCVDLCAGPVCLCVSLCEFSMQGLCGRTLREVSTRQWEVSVCFFCEISV